MPIARMTVNLSPELAALVKTKAAQAGLTHSAYAAMLIERGLLYTEREDLRAGLTADFLDGLDARLARLQIPAPAAAPGGQASGSIQDLLKPLTEIFARVQLLAANAKVEPQKVAELERSTAQRYSKQGA